MGTRRTRLAICAASAVIGASAFLAPQAARATTYAGNGATGFGGAIGNGNLVITADGAGNVTFTLNNASAFTGNDLVVYIDSVAGGFANTTQFSDNGDGGRESISAYNSGNPSRATVSFPTGFAADYALEFENDTYDGLFQLVAGGNNSLNYVTGNGPSTAGGPYVVTFPLSDIGLTTGQGFNFDADLISTSAYGSNETIGASTTTPDPAGGAAPNAGFNGSIAFTAADTFGVVPEPASLSVLGIVGAAGVARRRRTV
jgi:hypothetical protein